MAYRRCGFRYENKLRITGALSIAGIDEAGRGALAGPVVAAAAILPEKFRHRRLNDSKQLASELREEIYCELISNPAIRWTVGIVDSLEIDRINILRASLLAMQRAVAAHEGAPALALVDGNIAPRLTCKVRTLVDGDALSLSIAAASIVAKVWRDRMMAELATLYPAYGWEHNAGYATAEHRAALKRWGPTPEHRKSFRPVYEQLSLID